MSDENDAGMPASSVLVVNANPDVADLACQLFSSMNWTVEHVPDNEAALQRVHDTAFDVIVTSESTSAAKDVALLCRIRRMHLHTRMIILTDQSTPGDVIAAMRANAFSYLTAPFQLYQLQEILESAIATPPWDDGIELVSATPSWIHLYARCDLTTASRLVQFLNEIGDDLPEPERSHVSLAFREMLLNAIEHGGHSDPNEYVEISYLRSRRAVSCRIKDPGQGFSLEDIRHSAASNPPDDPLRHMAHREEQKLPPGGYGILFAQKLVDEVIYGETGNEVLLVKYLDQIPGAAADPDRDRVGAA